MKKKRLSSVNSLFIIEFLIFCCWGSVRDYTMRFVLLLKETSIVYFLFVSGVLYSDPDKILIVRNVSYRLTILLSPQKIDFTQENLRCILIDVTSKIKSVSNPILTTTKYSRDLKYPPSSQDNHFQTEQFYFSDYEAKNLNSYYSHYYSSNLLETTAKGIISVYQPRMNIDLFVFVSVFFSSFFLFLSAGICFWKVKWYYLVHRRRVQIREEFYKRLQRPFTKIQFYIPPTTTMDIKNGEEIMIQHDQNESENDGEDDDEQQYRELSSEQQIDQSLSQSLPVTNSIEIPLLNQTNVDYSQNLVSLEPLRDNMHCYATMFFHLPGDLTTQYRLCAGTTYAHIPDSYKEIIAQNTLTDTRKNSKRKKSTKKRKNRGTHLDQGGIIKKTITRTRKPPEEQQIVLR
ncbi:unnamed protein product [Didymodactylos carnosus]|uniref:Uncharacterized protein n=1 Tax=Didymodactylos carnosus TaxID=1234261 RepID=A0A814QGJ5_9BILA|nr:unnamed protein product [Didymodactylos carnosus]CAF3883244.1 unnamed protein product [Didymodactylos carnosus]